MNIRVVMHKKAQRRRVLVHCSTARHVLISTNNLQTSIYIQCDSAKLVNVIWSNFTCSQCDVNICMWVHVCWRFYSSSAWFYFWHVAVSYLCVYASVSSFDVLLPWFCTVEYKYLRQTSCGLRAHRTKKWPQKVTSKCSKMTPDTGPSRGLLGAWPGGCLGGRSRGLFGLPAAVLKEKMKIHEQGRKASSPRKQIDVNVFKVLVHRREPQMVKHERPITMNSLVSDWHV